MAVAGVAGSSARFVTAAPIRWVGVDGCRGGWFAATVTQGPQGGPPARLSGAVTPALPFDADVRLVLVDIPIGLVEGRPGRTSRACDTLARRLLAPGGGRSVFTPPARPTLEARDHGQACDLNEAATGKRLSIQAWHLVPRIREVDRLLRDTPEARGRIREAHPELLFRHLNGGHPLPAGKKTGAGAEVRLALLEEGFGDQVSPGPRTVLDRAMGAHPRRVVARDDVLDALVLALVAWRSRGRLRSIPDPPERDGSGLPMEMVLPEGAAGLERLDR